MTVRSCRRCGCTQADCSGCIARTGTPCHWVAEDLCSACSPVTLPEEITFAMREVLGLESWRTMHLAKLFRCAGHDIGRRTTDDRVFVIHRFLPLAVLHGDSWREWARRDVEATLATLRPSPSATASIRASIERDGFEDGGS